jgi:nicotinate-nucleotide adenylyltransferase
VAHFRRRLPADTELFWIVGADSLRDMHMWYRPDEIVRHCRVVTARRPGSAIADLPELRKLLGDAAADRMLSDVLETPHIDISATDIRRRMATGLPIRYLVPDAVEAYIRAHNLYR